MKKLLIISMMVAAGLFTLVTTTGCDANLNLDGKDNGLNKKIVDGIEVNPRDWREAYTDNGLFDHYYADISIPELTEHLLRTGFYYTYWKYEDRQQLVQEGTGVTMYYSFTDENGETIYYSESITCDYSPGRLRIHFRTSDFADVRPDRTFVFRFVAFW